MAENSKYNRLDARMIIGLGRAYRNAHKRSMRTFYDYGLTMPQFTVLEALYSKGDMTVKQIISKVLSSGGSMTVVIRNLEQQGLVRRRENPDDRRSYLISITDEGRKLMDVVFPLHMENLDITFSSLSDEEKATMIGYLKRISETNTAIDEPNGRKS
jgi:DNA-binding MarR family transcriptional regulator